MVANLVGLATFSFVTEPSMSAVFISAVLFRACVVAA